MICAYCQTTEVQYHFTCNDGVKEWVSHTCEEHLDIALTQLNNGDIDYEVKDLDIRYEGDVE